ncbi:ABC transporter ATP-binding protein [Pseudomonas sp. PDM16]|uniref:ABC transporter ATP-binding protein n=1 Tax=Pseudomonas sp. PDM16 TaxID=2769292 RepID=UPI001783FBC6|nr:ABC transporter ATP-binding protein [Pseudomonas sp. PDM16]MBD9415333.1 ABC transporter ATP-binding protein [Pseudomonas sp. PDM16]
MLDLRDLDLQLADAATRRWLLQDIALRVAPGERVGLIGPNGSGKTSLLRCVYRYRRPSRGAVELEGESIWARSPRWCAQRMAVLLQEFPEDFGLRVDDLVAMGLTPHKGLFQAEDASDRALIEATLQQVELTGYGQRRFADLSGGEKQRALLARALVQRPRLLILDEPTNHLDPRHQHALLQRIRELGLAVLASFHDLNLAAAFCDRLYLLDHGRLLASGTPDEVLCAEHLQRAFGLAALVDRHPVAAHPRITWIAP